MKATKIWRIAFGLWSNHLTLGRVVQASLPSRLIGAFAVFAALSLASCSSDEPDGKWEPMAWKAEVAVQKTDDVYDVSATGGEFVFSCRNYSTPWMNGAVSNGEYYRTPNDTYGTDGNDIWTITADWFKAEIDGNRLKVVFDANDTGKERPLSLTVTAGDIFYTFYFKQSAHR